MNFIFKITTLLFLLSFTIQNSYSQQNLNGWFWANSQPQANSLEWVQIIDATHIYAVGAAGTFMKSSDAGETWIINSQAGQPDPLFGSGGTSDLLTAWFFNANTGFVGGKSSSDTTSAMINRTTDGGNTFNSVGIGNGPGFSVIRDIYFINPNTGYLCGTDNVGTRKTTNGGLNWTSLPNVPVISYNCVYAFDENKIFLGVESDGSPDSRRIVRTTNGGSTWITDTLPGTIPIDMKDIVFQNSNTGYAAGNGTYFASTTNGGVDWSQSVFPNNQQGIYGLKLIGSTVYALGSYNSYYYTSNLGVTWDSVNFSDPSNLNQPYTFLVYAFDINANDAIVVGINGKVNVSNDGGASWRNKNYSVGNNIDKFGSVFALRGTNHVWAGGTSGLILHSTNSGTNWTAQQTTANYAIRDFDMLNSTTGYAVGGDPFFGAIGYCYKTTNAGTNWTQLTIPNSNSVRFTVDFVDANTGWIAGLAGLISKTTNGGGTWVNQASPLSTTIADIDMVNANTGYLSSGQNILKTTNGGNNWNLTNTLPAQNFTKINTFSSTELYVGGGQSIYKSTNSGTTWTSTPTSSSLASIRDMDWTDINNGIIVGTQGYTAKTSDGGLTWTNRNTGTSSIDGVSMRSKDTTFCAAGLNDFGAILRLYDGSTNISLNLTIGIQGFWNGSSQVSDTVDIHLMNSVSPFNEIEAVTGVLNTNGQGTFIFSSAPTGNYYIKITHRNSLETWNASPISLGVGGTVNYNFTTSASQAYGNNTILTSGRYCDYSGDVTQEGSVDLNDVVSVNNASSVFTTGYVVQDVTGDNLVDLSDLIITFNNASLFVAKITP